MRQNPKFVLTPLAAGIATALAPAPTIAASEVALEEIVVTARKRSESVQDVPVSIQAISEESLKDMNAKGLMDYSRFVPSVSVVGYGNGSSTIVFRGATITGGGYVAQSTSSMYLDEISVTATGDQPSVRMVDIERVEALSGPQGTIYGSDAQAGTMRVITNKPVMNEFEAVIDGSMRNGSEGEGSYDGSVVLNLPIVEDKLAIRLVGFSAKDGGYIDNVLGNTPDGNVLAEAGGLILPSGFGTLDNAEYVDNDTNDSKITGWRASVRWEINDNWSATLTALSQNTENGAWDSYDPYLGDLEIVTFYDDWRDDEYDLYSLTIEADLGFAQLVSATSYFERDIKSVTDLTVYHHYWSGRYCFANEVYNGAYYAAYGYFMLSPTESLIAGAYCLAPTVDGDYLAAYDSKAQYDRFTQEIRLSSQGDTFDWLVGLFYEESNNDWQDSPFGFPTSNTFEESIALQWFRAPPPWAQGAPDFFIPYTGTDADADGPWNSRSHTEWEQKAIFGEVVWHVSTKLDLTLGGRYFDRSNVNEYFVMRPNNSPMGEYLDADGNTVIPKHSGEETEFVPKIAASYHITDDTMVYGLWTQGFRPGGTNRQRGQPFLPAHYDADKLTNFELGVKSTFLDGRARANISAFHMDWEDFQLEIVDPSTRDCDEPGTSIPAVCGQPWQNVVANAGDAHITGVSLEFDLAVSENFTVGMNAQWLEPQTDTDLDLDGDGILDVVKDTKLPITPDWKSSAWATYRWPVNSLSAEGYARLQWSYQSDSKNTLYPSGYDPANPLIMNDAYKVGDLSIGVQAATWEASIFVNNLSDERQHYNHWGTMFGGASYAGRPTALRSTGRPREIGIRVIKHFN
ncbi:MAG: hypothetical protein CMQ19_00885 [Gammaproteobacteria bacterium]|nr:hypothetical protein [Gammaproteobacteria bacterium]